MQGLVQLIESNTSVKSLSIESNCISPELVAKVLRAAVKNQSLVELHAENQVCSSDTLNTKQNVCYCSDNKCSAIKSRWT